MQVKWGTGRCPDGFLPVYSVDTEHEARVLVAAACELGYDGEYYARELEESQTLDNLRAFGDRLRMKR